MKKIFASILIFGVVVSLVFGGCKSKEAKNSRQHHGESQESGQRPEVNSDLVIRQVSPEEVGKEVVCPVTKEKFPIMSFTKATTYKGKTYYFCCENCPGRFTKDPEKYAK